jgi:DNA-directed RNA polymerase specialized sigma24 family protein
VVATVERADLHAALGRLSDKDRQLLLLRYDEDLTQAAIASRLRAFSGGFRLRLWNRTEDAADG